MYAPALDRATEAQKQAFHRTFLKTPETLCVMPDGSDPVATLRSKKSEISKLAKGLVDIAEKEKRTMTTEERQSFEFCTYLLEDVSHAWDNKTERSFVTNALSEVNGVTNARSIETWEDSEGKKVNVLRPEHRYADIVGRDSRPSEITPGAYLRAMILGSKNEEVRAALAEGTDSAGGYTVNEVLQGQLIDLMRSQCHVISAGARTVPLTTEKTTIAKISGDASASWRNENAAVSESEPSFSALTFTARSLAVLVKVSRELLEDSVNIENALQMTLTAAMAQEADRVALFGSGIAPEPLGIFGTSGINAVSMATDGASITNYSKLLAAVQAMAENNSNPPTAAIMAPRTRFAFSGLVDTLGQPLNKPDVLASLPMLSTTKIPLDQEEGASGAVCSSIVLGDFTQCYLGVRSGMRIEVLKEAFAGNLQYGFLCHLRMDVQIAQPKSFSVLKGIKA